MLPQPIEHLASLFRVFPGVGQRSSLKLALDVLQMSQEDYNDFSLAVTEIRDKIRFCKQCGFFAEQELCPICLNDRRSPNQIVLVEKPTEVITMERSDIFRGQYHVLGNLISPLDNVFPENTNISSLFDTRIPAIFSENAKSKTEEIELILFLKSGFPSEATTAYIREVIAQKGLQDKVFITRLAQGLPLYFNPDTLDQATMVKALEDRQKL